MTMIEPMRRALPDAPRPSDGPETGERFGADLASAMNRRGPERTSRVRPRADETTRTESATEVERASDGPDASSAGAATETADVDRTAPDTASMPLEPETTAMTTTAGPTGANTEPRINNGGVCSCCTPGAFQIPVTTPAEAIAPTPVPSGALPIGETVPGSTASATGASTPVDDTFPPPSPNPAPSLPPPGGPSTPLGPPQPGAPTTRGVPAVPEALLSVERSDTAAANLMAEGPTSRSMPMSMSMSRSVPDVVDTDDDSSAVAPVVSPADPAAMAVVLATATPTSTTTPAPGSPAMAPSVAGTVVGGIAALSAAPDGARREDAGDTESDQPSAVVDAEPPAANSAQQSGIDLAASRLGSTADTPVTATSPLRGQSVSEGVLRSEHVRVLRELAPNRDVQRLAVELDGARVALRFDSAGARVNVVADPGNRLGQGWADDVQRTLNAGARQGSAFQQRDPDGGRRNRQAYEAPNKSDDRRAAEFSARLGAVEEG